MSLPGFGSDYTGVRRSNVDVLRTYFKNERDKQWIAKVHEIGTPDSITNDSARPSPLDESINSEQNNTVNGNTFPCGHSIWQDCGCIEQGYGASH